jgi:hypothetical protein
LHRHDFGAQELHAPHIERLPFDVDRTHVDGAVEAEERGRGSGRDTVLAGAGLGDDAVLAHPSSEQRLPEHVVDLVRTGVREVFALQQHAEAKALRESPAFGDRRRPARVAREQRRVLGPECIVVPRGAELRFELLECGYQCFRRIPAAVLTEATEADGFGTGRTKLHRCAAHRGMIRPPS